MTAELSISLDESRFDRQERILWWDQDRLGEAKVLVVGAGALGNEIVKNLVLVGVGDIVVLDFDVVEQSNLSRCIFFRPEDEGRTKAEALAERASAVSPASSVTGLARDVRTFGTGLALRADVVVGGLDSREARLFVNRMAWRAGRPWVDGAMEALSGVARVFRPPDSCYECTLTEADFEILSHRQSCRMLSNDELDEGKVPTTATTSSIVAGLQVQEVVKLLHQDRDGVQGLDGGYVLDGTNNDSYVIRYPFALSCQAHDTYVDPLVVEADDGTTFADLVSAAGWKEGLVELGDDHLVAWQCNECETTESAFGVVALLTFRDSECPVCAAPRQPEAVSAIAVPGEHSTMAIAEFGVRPDEVLAVRQDLDHRYVWARRADPELPEGWR